MSEGKRGADAKADDLADAPFIDDAERAEADWLLARENDPGAPAPSSKIARDYMEIDDLLGSLPAGSSDERWHEQVLKLASSSVAPSRPWWRRAVFQWATGGTLVAAAAAAVLMLRPRPRVEELEIAIHHGGPVRDDSGVAVVGDHLIVRARPPGISDLRVFRSNGTPVARCPGGPGCTTPIDGEHAIDVTLEAPVQYHVILVVGRTDAPPDATMNVFLGAAHTANARVVHQPIDVH